MKILISFVLLTGCVGVVTKIPTPSANVLILEHQNTVYKDIIRRQLEILTVLTTPDTEVIATDVENVVKDSREILKQLEDTI